MTTLKFELGDVLSITTPKFLASSFEALLRLYKHLCGFPVYTHELAFYDTPCRQFLLNHFPQLREVDASGVTPENAQQWLDEQVSKYGNEFEVPAIEGGLKQFNPVDTLAAMRGGYEGIIVVETGE